MVYFMENPIKIHDLGVPLFLETPIFCASQIGSFIPPRDEEKKSLKLPPSIERFQNLSHFFIFFSRPPTLEQKGKAVQIFTKLPHPQAILGAQRVHSSQDINFLAGFGFPKPSGNFSCSSSMNTVAVICGDSQFESTQSRFRQSPSHFHSPVSN